MRVAAIYRVSTDKQVRRDGEDSIPIQRTAVREFIAARTDWQLVREYAEEGVSGFKVSAEDRDVLQQAFRDAKAGLWQALVVFKADRLSRNALEYPVMLDQFGRIGCQVWSVKDAPGGKLLALDTQMDKFIRFLEGWQAETESRNTSIRVSEAMQQLARKGKWSGGPPPYGYRLNPGRRPKSDTPALLIDDDQAGTVRLMAQLYLDERMTAYQVARELNRRGIGRPAGLPWDDQKVRRVLQNPIIAGLPAYGRTRPSGRGRAWQNPYDLQQFILPRDESGNLRPVPELQILPVERWLQLLSAMASNANRPGGKAPRHGLTDRSRSAAALLTGLVYCGHCGARLSATTTIYRNRRRDGSVAAGRSLKYQCQTHAHRGRQFCDGQRTYGQRRLESAVLSQVEQLLTMMDPAELTALMKGQAQARRAEANHTVTALAGEVKKAERVLSGWLTRMDAFLANPAESPYDEELLAGKIREARQRVTDLTARCDALRTEMPAGPTPAELDQFAELAPAWWEGFQRAPAEEQKLLLRSVVERIIARRDEVEIIFRVNLEAFLPEARAMAAARQCPPRPAVGTWRPSWRSPR